MKKFNVTGMSCAACSARVERAVSSLEGVKSCSVSLLTNSMGVEGDVSDEKIIAAVESAGYGASVADADSKSKAQTSQDKRGDALADKETPKLIKRLIVSLCFLLPLMYVSMGHVMWGWRLPDPIAQNPMAIGLIELLLAVVVMVINQKFFVSGARGVIHRAPNMDTLVALGSGASFVWSVYILFDMSAKMLEGNVEAAQHSLHGLYFESAAMILTLITVGKMLEAMSKGRTTNALRSLIDLSPKRATVIVDGEEREVGVESIKIGDIFVIRPGESVAVDGVVIEGTSAIDESALTGESLPIDKKEGDHVSAGTVNTTGFLKCRAERVGEDTTLSQIIKIVSDASATKAPIAKAADKVSGIFVPVVILISLIALVAWLIAAHDVGYALARAISVLVISCPCALGLATPVAIMVGSGVGAKRGILFKTAESLEVVGKAKVVVLDKTGTVTEGKMSVTDVVAADGVQKDQLLSCACAVEEGSEHPLAASIVSYCRDAGVEEKKVEGFCAILGKGVEGELDGKRIRGGNLAFIKEICTPEPKYEKIAETLASQGKTPMLFSLDGQFMGIIAVADVIKAYSREAIENMKTMGIRVVMLTGDNERTARAIASLAGIDEVVAGVLPDGKADVIAEFKKSGKVVMVGDGINDAPALATADMGIAIGAGTDVAIEAADVVLSKSRLSDLVAAIRLSRATLKNIHENLFWAFFYNVIGIPLAAGLWIPIFGWELEPMFGAAAMSLSSFCVVMNALRLNLVRLEIPSRKKKKEENSPTRFAGAPSGEGLDQVSSSDESSTEPISLTTPATQASLLREVAPQATEGVASHLGGGVTEGDGEGNTHNDPSKENNKTEENTMTKTMTIEGMMCPHCSGRVRKCLEALDAVSAADVSHESGKAIVTLTAEIDNETLKKAVEDQGYAVVGIE